MAKIYNSDCTKGLATNAAIQQNVDKVPNELAEKIVPTFESNPEVLRRTNFVYTARAVNATTGNVFTPPTGKVTYLTAISLGVIKDAGSTSTITDFQANINGSAQRIVRIDGLTGVAQSEVVTIILPFPLKIDNNTTTLNNTTNNANITAYCSIFGYTIDNPNA